MSSTPAMAAGSYSASAMVPFTQTFVQSSGTTAVALVGQVLDNGATNFVGYDNGDAEYLLTSSAAGAQQTTLADGRAYFVSSGPAPAGYRATEGGAGSVSGSTSGASTSASGAAASSSESRVAMTTSRGSTTSRTSPGSASAASGTSTSRASGGRFSMGSAVACALGFVAFTVGHLA